MKKHIVLVTPGFPAAEDETSTVPYLQDYCRLLSTAIGAENITIVTTQYPFTQTPYTWNNIQVIPAGGANKKGISYPLLLWRTQRILQRACLNKNIVIHAFWLTDAAMHAAHIASKFRARCIVTLMGQDVHRGNKWMALIRKKVMYVALTSQQKAEFMQNYQRPVNAVIPFPLPEILLQSATHRTIDILFIGSYIPVKQPLQFIHIINNIYKHHPGIRAVMIGGGPLQNEMEREVRSLGVHENVIIHGTMPREFVFSTMQQAKILIHTSASEGQCMVYGEALLCGMHVLSYPVGRIVPTPKHQACNSTEDFISKTIELLAQPINFTPVQTVDAHASIRAYLELYQMPEQK